MKARLILAIVVPLLLVGCNRDSSKPAAPAAPAAPVVTTVVSDFGPGTAIKPGIRFREATLKRGNQPMKVWLYMPEKAKGKVPLVIVPPAGSTLFAGMDLGDGDRVEQFPYAAAGFAVASFEIDGHVPQGSPDPVVLEGAKRFRDAKAGLDNAKAALDHILAKEPNIDSERIYIAGHSSAGTLALLVAEHEPRIKACVAYAPVTDVEARLAPVIATLDHQIPGYRSFLHESAPKTHAAKLKCPVFLFYATDDSNVPPSQTTDFAAQLKATNSAVTVESVAHGGHYESMIRDGIPKGIAWLRKQPAAK
jgi:dipeptidyl aminopeptidase/acylaminoacyl peptidase